MRVRAQAYPRVLRFRLGCVFAHHAFVPCKVHWWYGPCASQSAMPSCPVTPHADIVMPDCSLLVTTFSRQTGPLQRMATRVTSMVTFIDEEYPVDSTKRSIKDARHL